MPAKFGVMLRAGVSALALATWMGNASAQSVTTNGDVLPSPADPQTWTISGDLLVGRSGTGTLSVEAGGSVSNTDGLIGTVSGSTGTVTVTGAGSTWTNSGLLAVGRSGNGTLSVAAGGAVSNTDGYIGANANSTGTATVTGAGSSWTNSGFLLVGRSGNGTLSVEAGGAVGNTDGYIGLSSGTTGTATVTGAGSSWTNSGELLVGNSGSGILTVADGGTVSAGGASGTGTVTIAALAGSSGTVNIGAAAGGTAVAAGTIEAATIAFGAGAGTLVFNHTGTDHAFAPSITGVGTINAVSGTTRLTADSSGFGGATLVRGGALLVDGTLGNAASTTSVASGGRLGGSGTLGGSVTVADGTLAGRQGQTLSVGGDLSLGADSIVDVTLGGAPSAALFDVAGDLALNGTLNVADAGGFGAGVYRLFDYGGTLTGNGLAIGAVPGGVDPADLIVQTAVANRVNLVSSAGVDLGFWDGGDASLHDNGTVDGGSGAWRADGRNWTDLAGGANGPFRPNPTYAVFQGGAGTVTVDGSAGAIGVVGMQFATDGYRIEGDAIALAGANGEAVIRVGDGTAAGAATTATIASALTGTSALAVADLGTLILSGTNSYDGGTILRAGTLSVSADANLGAASGGLRFEGGTLATTASFDSARSVTVAGSAARLDVSAGATLGLSGIVSGAGGIDLTGGGTLILSGANSYTGSTLVRSGTLVGGAGSIRGDIANAGTVVFEEAGSATFAGAVAGLGGTDGQMVKRGGGTLTLSGASSLDWSVEAGRLVSATDRFSGDLAITSGAGFTFDQTTNGVYAGTLSGAGDLRFTGGGTVRLIGDSSAYAGINTVTGSTLVVNGRVGGSAVIGAGGRLAGSGTIGSGAGSTVTLASGGTLAPGNSIGTLTVDGDLLVSQGARYEVEVAPGGTQSDRVAVTGSAILDGGTVAHIGMTGTYDPTAVYTILTAGDGVSGRFEAVTSDFAFLDAALGYGARDVTLSLTRNDVGFADVGATRNQRATAGGLESLAFGDTLYDAVVQLDAASARSAFDQLSGEIHASVPTGLTEDSRHVRDAATARVRAAFGDAGAARGPVVSYGPEGPSATSATDGLGLSAWGSAFGSWGKTQDDGNAARLDRSTGGLLVGADGLLADTWRIGLLAGYGETSLDLDARASSADVESVHLGLYGGRRFEAGPGAVSLRGGLAWTRSRIETDRSVGFLGFADTLTAETDADTLQAFGELGYGVATWAVRLEPFVSLAHVAVDVDGARESGGAGALTLHGASIDTTFTTLGLRAERQIMFGEATGGRTARVTGMAGWRHAFGDVTATSVHAFAGGAPFAIAGSPLAQDALLLEAGFEVDITPEAALSLSYGGQIGEGAQDHGFNAKLGVRF